MLQSQRNITRIMIILFVAGLSVSLAPAQGTQFGIRGGIYSDAEEAFLGAELNTPVSSHVFFNPNLEYVFIDNGTYITVNGDFHYDFNVQRPIYLWAGGGPALVFFDPDGPGEGDNDLGINLLAGIGFQTSGSLVPYFQAKAVLSDNDEVSIAFGLRF